MKALREKAPELWSVLPLVALVCLVALLGMSGSSAFERDATTALVYVVFTVGLSTFASNSGVLSFGHMAFVAIAAYSTALLTVPLIRKEVLLPDLPGFLAEASPPAALAFLIVVAFTALVAYVVAFPISRLAGIAASIATFAFLLVIHTVANNLDTITRGRATMLGVPQETTLGVALLGAIAAIGAAFWFQRSRVALRLRASRDEEVAAQALGIDIARDRRVGFAVSAAIVGGGGFLYAQLLGSFNPDAFYISATFLVVAMLVVGGADSLAGAVVGSVTIWAIQQVLRDAEAGFSLGPLEVGESPGLSQVGLALALLVILIFRPSGLTKGREFPAVAPWKWRRSRQDAEPAPQTAPVDS
jgi:branched-chain amino acid transport system permease protein